MLRSSPSVRRGALVPAALLGLLAAPSASFAVDQTYTNGYYQAVVSDTGNFAAKTGAGHSSGADKLLTFTQGGRSLVYSYDTGTYFPMAQLTAPKATLSALPTGVRASLDKTVGDESLHLDEDVVVRGTTEANSAIVVILSVRNDGAAPIRIGTRMAVDFKLAGDDGPVFTPDGGGELTQATRYVNPTFPFFSLHDNNGTNPSIPTPPTLRTRWTAGQGVLGSTPPDILEMADYGVKANPPLVPTLPLSSSKINADNEVRWIWGTDAATARTVQPGATAKFVIATSMVDVNAATPVNSAPPTIAGTPAVGAVLTAAPGTWSDTSGLTEYHYTWQRCDASGAHCATIPGATGETYTPTTDDLGHTLRVQVSADGSAAATSAATGVVALPDTAAPLAPAVTQRPADVSALTTAQLAFTGAEAGGTFECRIDDGTWVPCISPFTTPSLADGPHSADVRQVDGAGNRGAAERVTWTVDTAPPAAPLVTSAPAATTPATDATVAFTGEPGGGFQFQLDGGPWLPATSPLHLADLAIGGHTVKLRQSDAAGNVGATQTVAWTITPAPAPDAPATPVAPATPTPPADYPSVQAPAPAAPAAQAPAPAASPRPAVTFTPAVGGRGVQANDARVAPVTVDKAPVAVSCQTTGTPLAACAVSLYATVPVRGKRASVAGRTRQVLVGTAQTQGAAAGSGELAVQITLNASGRELLSRRPLGLPVRVDIAGTLTTGDPVAITARTALLPAHTDLVLDSFATGSAELPTAVRFALIQLAGDLPAGTSARIVGHTASGRRNDEHQQRLGLARATAVRDLLVARGAKARLTVQTRGDASPRDTNDTAPGRDRNRRVVIRIDRG